MNTQLPHRVHREARVYRWITFGIPELLASDNGRDFVSRYLRDMAARNGMSLQFTPVKTPRAKGTVERTFGTTNTRLLHQLPGTTLGKTLSHLNHEASKHAELTLSMLRELAEQCFVTVHNPAIRSRKWRSANDLFVEGIQRHPPRMPAAKSDLDALFGLTEYRVVQQYGIQYRYLTYQAAELVEVFHTVKAGTKLSFSIDITDLRSVRVQHPVTGVYFIARCTRDLGTEPYPLTRWLAHLGLMKAMKLKAGLDHDHALAELALRKKIASLSEAATKKARQAELRAYRRLTNSGLDNNEEASEPAASATAASAYPIGPTADVEDTLDAVFSKPL